MAKRKSIHIKGMEHGAPIPNGTVMGNLVFSSAISGKDAKTMIILADPDEQAAAMFRNLKLAFRGEHRRHAGQHAHMKVYMKEEKFHDWVEQRVGKNVSRRARPAGAPCLESRITRRHVVSNRSRRGFIIVPIPN